MVQGKRIVPYDVNNRLHLEVQNLMDQNSLTPGILEQEIGLLWGQGPELYKTVYENGDICRQWVEDKEVITTPLLSIKITIISLKTMPLGYE